MKFKLSSNLYDFLKWLCLLALPAVGVLWVSLATIWGWPYKEAVLGTISAVQLFLGTLIGVSHVNYYSTDGTEEIEED